MQQISKVLFRYNSPLNPYHVLMNDWKMLVAADDIINGFNLNRDEITMFFKEHPRQAVQILPIGGSSYEINLFLDPLTVYKALLLHGRPEQAEIFHQSIIEIAPLIAKAFEQQRQIATHASLTVVQTDSISPLRERLR